jgi:hypothetical protein
VNPTTLQPALHDSPAVAGDLAVRAFPLATPDFRNVALAFPDKVRGALELVIDPQMASTFLDQAEMLSQFARRVRADTNSINSIQYDKALP